MPDPTAILTWSLPVDRSTRNRLAIKAMHQFRNDLSNSTITYELNPVPIAIDITSWGTNLTAYISDPKGTGPALKTLTVGSGITIITAAIGKLEVEFMTDGPSGLVTNTWYLMSLYRTVIRRELAKVYFKVVDEE